MLAAIGLMSSSACTWTHDIQLRFASGTNKEEEERKKERDGNKQEGRRIMSQWLSPRGAAASLLHFVGGWPRWHAPAPTRRTTGSGRARMPLRQLVGGLGGAPRSLDAAHIYTV